MEDKLYKKVSTIVIRSLQEVDSKRGEPTEDTKLSDLEYDSLDEVWLGMDLEEKFNLDGKEFPRHLLDQNEYSTVRDLAEGITDYLMAKESRKNHSYKPSALADDLKGNVLREK